MTFLLAITLYCCFVACLAAVWLGWQSGEYLRFWDEWEAGVEERRAAIWRRIQAIDEVERDRAIRRKQAKARIALAALQSRVAATDGR